MLRGGPSPWNLIDLTPPENGKHLVIIDIRWLNDDIAAVAKTLDN